MTNSPDEIKELLTPPSQRDVKEMRLKIAEMEPGGLVGVTFKKPVFGVYAVWGPVARASHGDLVLSAYSIEAKGKPGDDVLRIDVSSKFAAAEGPAETASSLEHGTVVRATFHDAGGDFTVVGHAVVATSAPMVGVGRWVLAHKGQPGARLRKLDVLAAPGELKLVCPQSLSSWLDTEMDGAA
ncbi:MAG: hypothetical protein ACRC20_05940 [Segniliparus sp.]|uniref:hypothetical protein n=1 Tax=Segniliparus sp. TaxID=2804064 RepID=UPI003F327CE6